MESVRLAIVGSRGLNVSPEQIGAICKAVLPAPVENIGEVISGGAKGIDQCAAEFARIRGIKLTELKPDYGSFGRGAPHIRNRQIVNEADMVLVLWDGSSRGAKSVMDLCDRINKPYYVQIIQEN